jgi:ABC-type nitrate/sulfonate/bicarbonate transport system substrate-binding protein
MRKLLSLLFWSASLLIPTQRLFGDEITVALTSKAFQYVPLVIAQERGYMKEEGIDLKLAFMQNAPGLQALTANQVQFSGSGSSALVAISKGGAPLKLSWRSTTRSFSGSWSDQISPV